MGREKLVVEVVAAHNLMPKNGHGSSSPFVEVCFENQRLRTQAKYRDLNPVWNEKLVFDIHNPADLPYRTVECNVYNDDKSAGSSRKFLGKVRISAAGIAIHGQEVVQLFPLEKRSLLSHVRGEVSLKLYTMEDSSETKVAPAAKSAANGVKDGILIGGQGQRQKANKQLQAQSMQLFQQQMQQRQMQQLQEQNQLKQQQQQQHKPSEIPSPELKPIIIAPPEPQVPAFNQIFSTGGSAGDYQLKETAPPLGGGSTRRGKSSSTYDLVERMQYLYVRIVKARDFSGLTTAEVKLGNYRGITKPAVDKSAWDQTFAFSKDCIQSSMVEIFVKAGGGDDYLGRVAFDVGEVPHRVPPDSPLAPQWYRMEDRKGDKAKGEVMAAVWFGTQADEAFSEAWHSKAAAVSSDGLSSIKSKVYLSPKLWYLRVTIIEAQDLLFPLDKAGNFGRFPELSVKTQVGNQVLRTRTAPSPATAALTGRSLTSPIWEEEFMFVVAEPFEDYVVAYVEDHIGPGRDEVLGWVSIPVGAVERRVDDKPINSKWFSLDNRNNITGSDLKLGSSRFGSRIHMRICLEGGYHVLDESAMYSSDLRPTAKALWKPNIGVLEIGILGATGVLPMKVKDGKVSSTDAYCVAKYGQKWVRTRTVVDSLSPRWNEQYTWEVFDPCTVVTIGVFDNGHLDRMGGSRDTRIGKVRIRLSTLQLDRVYTHYYPLVMLHPAGVKKMGDLHLAVRFSSAGLANVLNMYTRTLLPKMHYVRPLRVGQLETLRYQATHVVATRLGRAEPPLGREVVEYMLDYDSHMWSMRRSKANFFRLVSIFSGVFSAVRWLETVRSWTRPVYSVFFILTFLFFLVEPELILPVVLFAVALAGLWGYRGRPRHPPYMDTRLSHAESVYPEELDEEFDTFPSSRSVDLVKMRYDRLRSVAGRVQKVVGDIATQAERVQALLSWRDPRASFLFVMACMLATILFYAIPFRLVVGACGIYALRPPRFRSKLPSPALSFFRRLPAKCDSLL